MSYLYTSLDFSPLVKRKEGTTLAKRPEGTILAKRPEGTILAKRPLGLGKAGLHMASSVVNGLSICKN